MDTDQTFSAWAIVDLFGHQRIAGEISEQVIGGETFVRVDVPSASGSFTRLFGKGAIYCISIVTEDVARAMAQQRAGKPVQAYELPDLRETPE